MNATIEPMVGRYVRFPINGAEHRVYFEEAGTGIPLVCLHTAGAHSSQYRHLMCDGTITERFRVIAFDLPWHGKSTPPPGWHNEEYRLTGDYYVAAIVGFSGRLLQPEPTLPQPAATRMRMTIESARLGMGVH